MDNWFIFPIIAILAIAGTLLFTSITGYVVHDQEVDEKMKALSDDDPFIGSMDAPVTMVAFLDFSQPESKAFFEDILPRLMSEYVDTGRLRFIFRDYTFGPYQFSERAAVAAECARRQGKFWEAAGLVFSKQKVLDRDLLRGLSFALSLDEPFYLKCLSDGDNAFEVKKDTSDGYDAGIDQPPGFVVNGQLLLGLHPYQIYAILVESYS